MGNCFGGGGGSAGAAAPRAAPAGGAASAPALEPFLGANVYYLLPRAADPGCRQMVLDTLDQAKGMGFTVIRCWAFNDGAKQWMSLQPAPGEYSQQVLQGLDWLLVEAGKRGLRLSLTLTNYWSEFGGMPQYVRWAKGLPDSAEASGNDFFSSSKAQQMLKDFMVAVVGRTNSITGIPYRDDPTIHSWDLANECRCEGDGAGKVAAWVAAAARHVKSMDPHHLVTVGLEGFFGPSSAKEGLLQANPYNQTHGVDWVAENLSQDIDYASIHMYFDQWRGGDDASCCSWSAEWVRAHMRACREALGGKPLVLQEFGKKPAGAGRAALFREMGALLRESVAAGDVLRGAMVWMFAVPQYPDYDGYTVYSTGAPDAAAAKESAQPVVADRESAAALRDIAAAVSTPAAS